MQKCSPLTDLFPLDGRTPLALGCVGSSSNSFRTQESQQNSAKKKTKYLMAYLLGKKL
jgi:hypothetical protein